jgi:HEXXH motif-containing protein
MESLALDFLHQPFPLWEVRLTAALVASQWELLAQHHQLTPTSYHTASLLPSTQPGQARLQPHIPLHAGVAACLELPESDHLGAFYADHGLKMVPAHALASVGAIEKLRAALSVLDQQPGLSACLDLLLQSIQVLRQEDPDTDASFSHPAIPFTIFVTVCPDISPISNLRVAEAILHETMHLKLTLVEAVVPIVEAGSTATYYSPWRDEPRPLRGVLHGMFVFRAVLDFYTARLADCTDAAERRFMVGRMEEILAELGMLRGVGDGRGLTLGRHLIQSLLP